LVTPPVAREPRTAARAIRARLGIPSRARVVLITMGGIPQQHAFLDRLAQMPRVHFVVPGMHHRAERRDNVILLPHRSTFYHPDLVHASDVVIGKAGYSTVAEAYRAGVPFGFVSRAKFREARTMARFIKTQMHGIEISPDEFAGGHWLARLDDLLALPRLARREPNGATSIARFIQNILEAQ
jgi:predicted glycosyltransferase